jgi:hypothetical protein
MGLLPFQIVPLVSDLPPGEVAARLRECIAAGPDAPFDGSTAADGFLVTRVREYRSTAMPLVRGSLAPAPGGGTVIRLRLRPPTVVVVFMGVWLGFLGALAAMVVVAHAADAGRSLLPLLVPAGLAAASWALMVSVFTADARWALQSLMRALPFARPCGGAAAAGCP